MYNYVFVSFEEPTVTTGLSIVNVTETLIELVWDHFTGTPGFTTYVVEYTDDNWQSIQTVEGLIDNQYTITDLDLQNRRYSFRVFTVVYKGHPFQQQGEDSMTVSSKISVISNTSQT